MFHIAPLAVEVCLAHKLRDRVEASLVLIDGLNQATINLLTALVEGEHSEDGVRFKKLIKGLRYKNQSELWGLIGPIARKFNALIGTQSAKARLIRSVPNSGALYIGECAHYSLQAALQHAHRKQWEFHYDVVGPDEDDDIGPPEYKNAKLICEEAVELYRRRGGEIRYWSDKHAGETIDRALRLPFSIPMVRRDTDEIYVKPTEIFEFGGTYEVRNSSSTDIPRILHP